MIITYQQWCKHINFISNTDLEVSTYYVHSLIESVTFIIWYETLYHIPSSCITVHDIVVKGHQHDGCPNHGDGSLRPTLNLESDKSRYFRSITEMKLRV